MLHACQSSIRNAYQDSQPICYPELGYNRHVRLALVGATPLTCRKQSVPCKKAHKRPSCLSHKLLMPGVNWCHRRLTLQHGDSLFHEVFGNRKRHFRRCRLNLNLLRVCNQNFQLKNRIRAYHLQNTFGQKVLFYDKPHRAGLFFQNKWVFAKREPRPLLPRQPFCHRRHRSLFEDEYAH